MRDYGTIGFSFAGDVPKARGYASLARTYMGEQSNYMSFGNLPSHIMDRKLDDGTIIRLIQLPGGIKRIHIVSPFIDDDITRGSGGIVVIPQSAEYSGWGFDYVDEFNQPINGILGTEDGNHKEVIHREGRAKRSDSWWPLYSESPKAQEQEDRGYGAYSELECGLADWKSLDDEIVLSWKSKDRYFNRYYTGVAYNISYELYKDGYIYTKASNRIIGAAINSDTKQLIVVTYDRDITTANYKWYSRPYKETYENDNPYNSETNPDGWRSLGSFSVVPVSGTTDHIGSCVLFNESGTECVVVYDQGTTYKKISVDTISDFDITTEITESVTTLPTYNKVITDEFPGFSPGPAGQNGGIEMDLQEYRYKIAADYKGDDLVFLELNKRLKYDSDRTLVYNSPTVTCTATVNHINEVKLLYNGTEIYLNNQNLSGTASWVRDTVSGSSGGYSYSTQAIRSEYVGTNPSTGKVVSADLRYGYIHIYRYIETAPITRTVTMSGSDYNDGKNSSSYIEQDNADGFFTSGSVTNIDSTDNSGTIINLSPIGIAGSSRLARRLEMEDFDWLKDREDNWSDTNSDSYTLGGNQLDLPLFDDIVYLDSNDEAHVEILSKNNEWVYNSYLFFEDEIIYEYSNGNLDVLSPIYTTELQHKLKGVI